MCIIQRLARRIDKILTIRSRYVLDKWNSPQRLLRSDILAFPSPISTHPNLRFQSGSPMASLDISLFRPLTGWFSHGSCSECKHFPLRNLAEKFYWSVHLIVPMRHFSKNKHSTIDPPLIHKVMSLRASKGTDSKGVALCDDIVKILAIVCPLKARMSP